MTLKIRHIAHAYGQKQVLTDVSFDVDKGEIAVLMGANGSGKTTLFNIISGFLKQDAGEVILNGKKTDNNQVYQINRLGITRTFQDMRLIGNLTVKENVLLAFPNQKGEKWWNTLLPNKSVTREQQANAERADEILKTCFIEDAARSQANEISYGQQKLLNLACSMANNADVFLLDEPVAGVNPAFREMLVSVVQNIKRQGKALLIIEHNTDFIEAVSDKILFLNEGKITEFADYRRLRENKTVQEAYI